MSGYKYYNERLFRIIDDDEILYKVNTAIGESIIKLHRNTEKNNDAIYKTVEIIDTVYDMFRTESFDVIIDTIVKQEEQNFPPDSDLLKYKDWLITVHDFYHYFIDSIPEILTQYDFKCLFFEILNSLHVLYRVGYVYTLLNENCIGIHEPNYYRQYYDYRITSKYLPIMTSFKYLTESSDYEDLRKSFVLLSNMMLSYTEKMILSEKFIESYTSFTADLLNTTNTEELRELFKHEFFDDLPLDSILNKNIHKLWGHKTKILQLSLA